MESHSKNLFLIRT